LIGFAADRAAHHLAAAVGKAIRNERGAAAACDEIERVLR
jgi:hypothetical protein